MTYSEEYRRSFNRLLTFSGIAFSLKIIPLEAITISDVTITMASRPVAIGLICFFIIYLLLNYVVLLIRDFGHQRVLDSDIFHRTGANDEVNLLSPPTTESQVADRNLFFARLHIALDSVLPALFAVSVVMLCRGELLTFFEHLWAVISGNPVPADNG